MVYRMLMLDGGVKLRRGQIFSWLLEIRRFAKVN